MLYLRPKDITIIKYSISWLSYIYSLSYKVLLSNFLILVANLSLLQNLIIWLTSFIYFLKIIVNSSKISGMVPFSFHIKYSQVKIYIFCDIKYKFKLKKNFYFWYFFQKNYEQEYHLITWLGICFDIYEIIFSLNAIPP